MWFCRIACQLRGRTLSSGAQGPHINPWHHLKGKEVLTYDRKVLSLSIPVKAISKAVENAGEEPNIIHSEQTLEFKSQSR